jgi:hypothetical protein
MIMFIAPGLVLGAAFCAGTIIKAKRPCWLIAAGVVTLEMATARYRVFAATMSCMEAVLTSHFYRGTPKVISRAAAI